MPELARRLFWIGSNHGMEREILERTEIPFSGIPAGKLRRYFSLRNLADLFKIAAGLLHSLILLKRLRVGLLFSKGGYVSVPPVLAARLLGIPVISHESDRDPGLATRINARFSDLVLCAYRESCAAFAGRATVEALGNPIRRAILEGDRRRGRTQWGVGPQEKLLVVLGGSQGARQINAMVEGAIEELLPLARVVHQTGRADYRPSEREGYYKAPFFHEELPDLLAAADLVVSRAGAGTLWENGVTGTPAILVPLGLGSSRGDQLRNARLFAERGAAEVLEETEADPQGLLRAVRRLLTDEQRRRSMARATRELCDPLAAEAIAERIERYLDAQTHTAAREGQGPAGQGAEGREAGSARSEEEEE
jgi:UDP-N-acetylglucosamine--N-acetylmuramyl-(pentapeptide) pyrophosphoryl-undecaprenol N-acetylglucosamine transferase